MITKKQHKELCRHISRLHELGFDVVDYLGNNCERVSVSLGEIYLSNKTIITWRSYQKHTKLTDAWDKFYVPKLTIRNLKHKLTIPIEESGSKKSKIREAWQEFFNRGKN